MVRSFVGALAAIGLLATPSLADDGHHRYGSKTWRDGDSRGDYYRPTPPTAYRYAPPRVYEAAPPAYHRPPPRTYYDDAPSRPTYGAPSFNLVIPVF